MAQTAIQWLKEQYINRGETLPSGVFQEALEKEKEQIVDAYENGVSDENERNLSGTFTNAEQYYNTEYKNK